MLTCRDHRVKHLFPCDHPEEEGLHNVADLLQPGRLVLVGNPDAIYDFRVDFEVRSGEQIHPNKNDHRPIHELPEGAYSTIFIRREDIESDALRPEEEDPDGNQEDFCEDADVIGLAVRILACLLAPRVSEDEAKNESESRVCTDDRGNHVPIDTRVFTGLAQEMVAREEKDGVEGKEQAKSGNGTPIPIRRLHRHRRPVKAEDARVHAGVEGHEEKGRHNHNTD
mmetsp:Transcript_84913/g.236933  ORF Transcript_84913/g.236933 Transcript_84913/m.236933 type:complete len:225 (+) Transcript_84913:335-1009(+)